MWNLLPLFLLFSTSALAQETSEGRIVANNKAGFEVNAPSKAIKALLRCMVRSNPDKQPINIYLPPAGNSAFEHILKGTLKWNAATFERERIAIEQRAGRICYVRKKSIEAVIEAVAADPGGVGLVPITQPVPPELLVIWGEAATPVTEVIAPQPAPVTPAPKAPSTVPKEEEK